MTEDFQTTSVAERLRSLYTDLEKRQMAIYQKKFHFLNPLSLIIYPKLGISLCDLIRAVRTLVLHSREKKTPSKT